VREKGLSREVAHRVAAPQAETSRKGYDGKFEVFRRWCFRNDPNIDPYNPSMPQITDFLQYAFDDLKLQYSTLIGYRAMFSSTLKHHTELDISHSQILGDLLRSFKRERPPGRHCRPEWDIALVLFSLTKKPYENVWKEEECDLQHLTWKTVFLILLASGARRGEIHAIKYKGITFAENSASVTLTPDPEFIPKSGMRRQDALKPIKIPSLCRILPEQEVEDRALCPVRCLKAYLSRTKHLREDRKYLFVSMLKRKKGDKDKKGDISKNTLSGWVRKLILECYQNPTPHACELTGTRTHDVRGFAHTLIYRGTVAMEDLVRSGSWKSHNTFTSHYLKDLTEIDSETLLRLGPVVAAQKVVVHASI